jgi:hypothetical protein
MRNALMASTAVVTLALAGGPTLAQDQSQDPAAQPIPPAEAPAEAQGAPVPGEGDAGATAEAAQEGEAATTADAPAEAESGATAEAPAAEAPAAETGATADVPPAEEPAADSGATAEAPEMESSEEMSTETADTGASGGGQMFVTAQDPQQAMANDMIGAQLLGADDAAIGSVSDLVLDQENKIVAAVVGVGGFLGLGQTEVAIAIDQIDEISSETGQVVFRVDATKEVLEEAPEFRTVADQEAEAAQAVPPSGSATTGTTPPASQ